MYLCNSTIPNDYSYNGTNNIYVIFQIIYVAPMKALAAEVVQKFSRQLQCLGISVRELTGDMQLTKREIENTQVPTLSS